jgi:hypothetical protein
MKLKELFEAPRLKDRSRFADAQRSPSFISKIKQAINPAGEAEKQGEKQLATKTNALLQRWSNYRGQTKAIPNAANVEHWVKDTLGLDDPEIWSQAVEEFSEENPEAGEKYKDQLNMDPKEISDFFSKLVQIRLMNPGVPLWKSRTAAQAQASAKAAPAPIDAKKKVRDTGEMSADDEKKTGLPPHPVFAQSGIHMEPNTTTANKTAPATPTVTPAQANNPGINPKPENMNKPAMLPSDDQNAVDWNKIRDRFPQKPRFKVPMASNKID